MPEISTGYKPNYALGALYQGFNAADADEASLQSIMHQFLLNQREQQQEPLDRLNKMWQAKESLGKMQDPEYLKSMLEGYKGLMNTQIAHGKEAMGTADSKIPVVNQDNRNKLFMGKTLEDWNNLRMSQQPQEQQGTIGIPMQSPERVPEQWGGEGLQQIPVQGDNGKMGFNFGTAAQALQNPELTSLQKKIIMQDAAKRKENIAPMLANFAKQPPQQQPADIEKLQNILVNSPEHLRAMELASLRGDYALEGISLRNRAMLESAGKKMTGSNKPLKLDEGLQIATDIIAKNVPGEQLEWAKRYKAIYEDVKVQSNAVAHTQSPLDLPATAASGKPVATGTASQNSAEKLRNAIGGGEVRQYDQATGKRVTGTGTKEDPIKLK